MSAAEESFMQRGCPACGGTLLDSWAMSSEPPAEEVAFSELLDSWRGFFKDRKHFFTYRRCRTCGQVYSPRYFTSGQLTELYRQMDDNTAGLPKALLAKTQRGYFEMLRKCADFIPGGYLELGPDIGLFTREVLRASRFSPWWMVEPNLAVHPDLEELLRGQKHTLLADRFDVVPDESLALAVAIHVLDHLLEPQILLGKLLRKLRPGGSVLIVTHNQDSLPARAFGHRWPPYCLQHPQLYTAATLKNNLERVGFDPVRVRGTVNHFPVTYLLRHFFFAAGLGRVALPEMPSWTVGIKLGNIAAIGRKPSSS